jgi:hypothetical protein
MAFWYVLWALGKVCCHLYFVVFWYNFPRFGKLRQEKSGNPDVGCFERRFVQDLSVNFLDSNKAAVTSQVHKSL